MPDRPTPAIVIRSASDVARLINSGAARGANAGMITFIALGGIFIDAYDFTSISFGLPGITKVFRLGPLAEGVVGASIMIGALLGALAGGYLVDRLGRYKIFMADMLFFVVAALACAVAPNVTVLVAARLLMGFGIGMDFPVALAFIAEFTALRGKGGRVTLWQVMWYAATTCSFLVLVPLYFLIPATSDASLLWRWAVGFGALPALVVMLVRRRYMDESPLWAANQGDLPRAAAILRRCYGVDAAADPATGRPGRTPRRPGLAAFRRLFGARYRRRTVLSGIVCFCQAMQYYAVGFALPAIIAGLLHQGTLTTIVGSLLFNFLFGLTGAHTGSRLADRWGSWRLSATGFAVCLIALVALGLLGHPHGTGPLLVVGLMIGVFMFFHAAGPGAQGMTMASLSYPTSLRGVGTGFAEGVLRVGSTISLLWFPALSKHFATGVFYLVALVAAAGLLALLLIRWEPVGADVDADDYAADLATAAVLGREPR
jgi:MFS family permease